MSRWHALITSDYTPTCFSFSKLTGEPQKYFQRCPETPGHDSIQVLRICCARYVTSYRIKVEKRYLMKVT